MLNIQLGAGVAYTLQTPTPQVGAVYSGLVVGVTSGGNVVKPLAERWPDASGAFSMRLPASVRGKTVHFWENQRQFFSHFAARPGGAVDLASWPSQLGDAVPSGLASARDSAHVAVSGDRTLAWRQRCGMFPVRPQQSV